VCLSSLQVLLNFSILSLLVDLFVLGLPESECFDGDSGKPDWVRVLTELSADGDSSKKVTPLVVLGVAASSMTVGVLGILGVGDASGDEWKAEASLMTVGVLGILGVSDPSGGKWKAEHL